MAEDHRRILGKGAGVTEDVLKELATDPAKVAVLAKGQGLVEVPNCGRADLAKLFALMGYRVGAEIGVERGMFSEVICKANPGVLLHCVDAWRVYPGYREHLTAEDMDRLYNDTRVRLAPFSVELHRQWSMEAVHDFEDGSLDFVYIDAAHDFRHVAEDLVEWSKKVRSGGIVAGHDYARRRKGDNTVHVVEVVEAYVKAFHIAPYFVLGRKDEVAGEVRDTPRSFFWIKP